MEENKQNKEPLNKDFKVPKLRFKEFNKPWKNENFSTLFQYIPTNSLSWDALSYLCGSLRNLHYGIIHSDTNEILSAVNLPFINNCSIPKKYTKAIPGDLFLADTSEDRKDCGKGIEINGLSNHDVVGGLHTIHIRDKQSLFVPFYKALFTRSNTFHKFTYKYSEGIKVFSLKRSLFKYLDFYYPEKVEQQKIVDLFEYIDTKITFMVQKIKTLKKYKKGLLQKISICGKPYVLNDILKEENLRTKTSNEYQILSSTSEGIFLQSDYFNHQVASSNNMGYKIIRRNQMVFSPQNLWLGNINLNDKFEIGAVSPSYKIYSLNLDIVEPNYFIEYMKSPYMIYQYKLCSEQGASIVRRNLDIDSFLNIKIKLPTLEDQQVIKFLQQHIFNLKNSLMLLNKIKKYLLKNMFI